MYPNGDTQSYVTYVKCILGNSGISTTIINSSLMSNYASMSSQTLHCLVRKDMPLFALSTNDGSSYAFYLYKAKDFSFKLKISTNSFIFGFCYNRISEEFFFFDKNGNNLICHKIDLINLVSSQLFTYSYSSLNISSTYGIINESFSQKRIYHRAYFGSTDYFYYIDLDTKVRVNISLSTLWTLWGNTKDYLIDNFFINYNLKEKSYFFQKYLPSYDICTQMLKFTTKDIISNHNFSNYMLHKMENGNYKIIFSMRLSTSTGVAKLVCWEFDANSVVKNRISLPPFGIANFSIPVYNGHEVIPANTNFIPSLEGISPLQDNVYISGTYMVEGEYIMQ